MRFQEPVTMLTDYLLGTVSVVLGTRLVKLGRSGHRRAAMFLGSALIASGIGAYAGGSFHGLALLLDPMTRVVLWKLTVWLIGVASFSFAMAIVTARFSGVTRTILALVFAAKLVVYSIWILRRDEFKFVIADYGSAMIFVLIVEMWQLARRRDRAAAWIVAGIVTSFVGAAVQMSGFALHPHFNHNDLYHVIQIGAVVLFYRGGMLLPDAVANRSPMNHDQASTLKV